MHERRIVLLAVAALFLLPPTTARAQARAFPTGASATVIDSADIAASGARTLSELLMARVPGLSVRYRGGMESEGAEVSTRGTTSARGFAPMLVIDGVLAGGDQEITVPGTSATTSRLDDLTPNDVQRIEVLHGPAASARYGFGAGAGVIAVTTRRGRSGALAFDVSARAGLTALHSDFPANYQLTSGAPGQSCNPHLSAPPTPACTPSTLYSWSPLSAASPFRVGRTTSARAAMSGTTFGARTLAAVTAEHAGGVTRDDWQSRVGLRTSVERELPGHVTVGAQGSYLERNASVPARGPTAAMDNVIYRGLMGSAYDDSLGGYVPWRDPASTLSLPEPSLVRVTSALRVDWRPLSWLAVDALGGQDRYRTNAVRAEQTMFNGGALRQAAANGNRWTSGTMHLGAEASTMIGTSIGLSTYVAYDDVRRRDLRYDSLSSVSSRGGYSYSTSHQVSAVRAQEATVRQHVGWSDALDLNAVTRWPVGRGISAPFGVESSRSLDAALRLGTLRDGLDLRLRAAAGSAPLDHAGPNGDIVGPPSPYVLGYYGPVAPLPRPRRNDVEGGIDARIGRRAQLELTWFHARSSDLATADFRSGGFRAAGISDRGIEAMASAQLMDGPRVGWRTTVTAASLRSRVTSSNGSGSPYDPYQVGYPPQGIWKQGYNWSDANADGYISPAELTFASTLYVGPSAPTMEVGVRNSLTLPGAVTLAALLDYRGGQYRDNRTEQLQCLRRTCLGLNDLSQSLEEQARWVAMSRDVIGAAAEPASFTRLRELVIDWAPGTLSHIAGARRVSVRLIGQNLATWTQYRGIDPEVGATTSLPFSAVTDLFQGPLPRRVSLEVRMGTGGSAP